MIEFQQTILSDDIVDSHFVCDLIKCKGACCVEGDLGAPLEKEELTILDEIVEQVKPYMSKEGLAVLEAEGAYLLDDEGDFSTTTVGGKECAFAVYDDRNILKCSIEQAWKDGKVPFRKPISCHLYPIRAKQYAEFIALNYDRWSICSPACDHGKELKVPLYQFLREPLIRRFGKVWYAKLETIVKSKS